VRRQRRAFAQVTQVCGDAFVEAGESCDDGATLNGDGCSSTLSGRARLHLLRQQPERVLILLRRRPYRGRRANATMAITTTTTAARRAARPSRHTPARTSQASARRTSERTYARPSAAVAAPMPTRQVAPATVHPRQDARLRMRPRSLSAAKRVGQRIDRGERDERHLHDHELWQQRRRMVDELGTNATKKAMLFGLERRHWNA